MIHVLLLQRLVPGILVLGAVLEVHEYEVVFSLPFNMRGTVAVSDISDPVTKLVELEAQHLETSQESDEENEVRRITPCMYPLEAGFK